MIHVMLKEYPYDPIDIVWHVVAIEPEKVYEKDSFSIIFSISY